MIRQARSIITSCRYFPSVTLGLIAWFLVTAFWAVAQEDKGKPARHTLPIEEGNLSATIRDNAQSPEILSGVSSLLHRKDAPGFPAFNPGSTRYSGLNFEHIIAGHRNRHNIMSPRKGAFDLSPLVDGKSVQLVRKQQDDPWAMSSTLKYTVAPPHYIDVDFRSTAHDQARFGPRGYAILFFANYMNDAEDVALHFRGVEGPNQEEKWVRADASQGPRGKPHTDWDHGGTYRSLPAADLEYDADHNYKLNCWSYDYPRFTKPFYFGKAGQGMVFMLMFDRMHSAEDEIRFSLFKFSRFSENPNIPRPAWDFQYVIHKAEEKKEYGFKARLVWKKFVSPEDCLSEYDTWAASLGKAR